MNNNEVSVYKNKIITIPNILSCFRICLIPLIAWLYCIRKNYRWTTAILTLSGITDVIDGIVARKCNMVSDVGKALDPIADKLTQIVMLFCLVTRFHAMLIPLILLTAKEIFSGIMGMITIKKTGVVMSAVWHGKLSTVLLYVMMVLHLIWYDITPCVSNVSIAICTCMILLSGVLYTVRNIAAMNGKTV